MTNAIYQAVTFKGLTVAMKASAAREALKKGFRHLVGNIEVAENASGEAVLTGQLKNYDIDISEFKPGIGGQIYDLISPYDLQYELSKVLNSQVSIKEIDKSTRIDSAAKVGDRVDAEIGW